MAPISLKIISNEGAATRKVKFDTKMTVRDAHAIIKEKVIVPDPTKGGVSTRYGCTYAGPLNFKPPSIWVKQLRHDFLNIMHI